MATATMNLSIVNPSTSGVASDSIFVSIIGLDPTSSATSYVDLSTGQLVQFSGYQSGVTSRPLAQLGSSIPVPAIKSARIYLAIGSDFSAAEFPASGPTASDGNPIMFDKIEFDTSTSGSYNINSTNVDFYAFSYTLTATPNGSSTPRTVGFTASRTQIIQSFFDIPTSPGSQKFGNTGIFSLAAISANDEVLRVLSPKSMALTDWGPDQRTQVQNANLASHFLDKYVAEHCWKPNRTFSFYDKFWPTPAVVRYGQVSADGLTLNLYTDAARTQPYAPVPTLPRPRAAWPLPDFDTPSNYHNVAGSSVDDIDWGFLLIGNSGGSGVGANWASDPAAIAIMVAIDRGVMHLDDGTTSWTDPSKYYLGDGNGRSTEATPTLYYSKLLHAAGQSGAVYALSYDDVYGQNSSIFFADGGDVTIELVSLESVPTPT